MSDTSPDKVFKYIPPSYQSHINVLDILSPQIPVHIYASDIPSPQIPKVTYTQQDTDRHFDAIAATCMALDTIKIPYIRKVVYTHHTPYTMTDHCLRQRQEAIHAAAHRAVEYVNEIITRAGEGDIYAFVVEATEEDGLHIKYVVHDRIQTVVHLIQPPAPLGM